MLIDATNGQPVTPKAPKPARTKCKHGHDLTIAANIYDKAKDGATRCLICRNDSYKRRANNRKIAKRIAQPQPPAKWQESGFDFGDDEKSTNEDSDATE